MLVSERKTDQKKRTYREFQGQAYRQHKGRGEIYTNNIGGKSKALHRVLWEHLNGPIPHKFAVVPVDGNWEDFSPENWICRPHAKNAPGMKPTRPVVEYNGQKYYKDTRARAGYYVRQIPDYCYLHRAVWMDNHGSIPKGHIIHHIDGDRANNNIENLRMFASQSEHNSYHEMKKKEQKYKKLDK